VPYAVHVASAHRTPHRVEQLVKEAERDGARVIIAGAGGAAHLAGVIASHSMLPVIGVPLPTLGLGGFDALLATVQMPRGVPVATVGLGNAGNAALLALQILALADARVREYMLGARASMREKVLAKDEKLQTRFTSKKDLAEK
jgi:5-(carboxyamino)imidazole ribonucleotide mutase